MRLPVQAKEAVLKRVLMGNRPHHEVALEFGIGRSTIGKWLKEYKQTGNINLNSKEKRPKDWTATERLSALIETGSMTEEERAFWCRKKGVFTHHLEQWKKDAISAMTPLKSNKEQNEKEKALQKEILVLKRDLLRKDKALAETAALLVLKKKSRKYGGSQRTIDQSGR